MFVGVGASRVRDLFEQGKKNAPCIIFIDEIDAVGRHRGAGLGGGHDEREQTLNQLLVEMDGFESNDGVILIAATNRPDVLDPALLRPGRFDRRIVVPRPDVKGRLGILKVHTKKTPLSGNVDLDVIARGTPGFSGADLENLVNEAALLAARADKTQLDGPDFEMAKDKVLMGPERRSMIISDSDKRVTAFHEAGHALVGKMMKGSDPVHKVTIIPRGRALGLTQQLPAEDRLNLSKDGANDQIAVAMGGRVAEELIFHQLTTGASNDIQVATDLARKMVCEWGMSDKLGPLHFGKREGEVFLGRDFGDAGKDYSEQTAIEIDAEVRKVVTTNYERAKKIVMENLDKLRALAEALLEYETVDGQEIDTIFAGGRLDRKPSVSSSSSIRAATPKAAEKPSRPSIFPRPLPDPEKA
jgi:cell division protease FtsH